MKLLALLLPLFLFAESYLVSNIPLPKSYIQNLDIETCDTECLHQYLKYGAIFSFLAHTPTSVDDPELNEARLIHVSLLNLATQLNSKELKIAMLLPHREIGRYTQSTTNALFAYLLSQNADYELKSYYVEDESYASIAQSVEQITQEGYPYLIAPVTLEGAKALVNIDTDLSIFVPTVNKKDLNTTRANITFGGIDYSEQIERLMSYANAPLIIFYDESRLGRELKDKTRDGYILSHSNNTSMEAKKIYSYGISKRSSNLKYPLSNNKKLELGSFFLNTPVVKTGMIMSQITLYDVNATNILSTQINYDPLLFTLTQPHDRKNMYIANVITAHNSVITESNALLNNDIEFDWINYATTLGSDYFYALATSQERQYDLPITARQVDYPISIVSPGYAKFTRLDEPLQK